jgi:hypothetical protein
MALSRKGSRLIHVEGESYRWVVKREETARHLVVEAVRSPGQRLYVEFDHDTSMIPSLVSRFILEALAGGWRPHERGPQMSFGLAGDQLVPLEQWRKSRQPPSPGPTTEQQ